MSADSLADRVAREGLLAVVLALLGAGLTTAVILHLVANRLLDDALAAAVTNFGPSLAEPDWDVEGMEHTRPLHAHAPISPIRVQRWSPDLPLATQDQIDDLLRDEVPRWSYHGDERVLLVVVEPAHEITPGRLTQDDESDHPHIVLVAHAPAPTPLHSTGPFLVAFAAVSTIVGVTAWFGLRRSARRVTGPLREVATALSRALRTLRQARLVPPGITEVDAVVVATNKLLHRLDDAFTAQAQFTAEAAHELRTPLTVMVGELDLATRRERTPQEHLEILRRVRAQAGRLQERVEALMALARVDAGQADQVRERERISAILMEAINDERPALQAADCVVNLDVSDDPELDLHPDLVRLAVSNLLRNAARHAGGARVDVTTSIRGDLLYVFVDDAGPGVAEGDRTRVFDRFARNPGSTGLGLGLPMARQVASRHGGDVWLESSPWGGCRAVLTLALPTPR